MAKSFKGYKPPKLSDFFKMPKESKPKKVIVPHIQTAYETMLIDILRPAIENKNLIQFWYKDTTTDFEDFRIVEPHLIGQSKSAAENIHLSAWFLPTEEQIEEGHFPDWKVYILDNVKRLQILPQTFKFTRPRYNPNDSTMKRIICRTMK